MKILKLCVATALVVLAVAVVAAFLALQLVDRQEVAALVQSRVEAQTGRALVIDGAIEPALGFKPAIRLEDVRLANPKWAKHDSLLAAQRLYVSVRLWPLLRGTIEISELTLEGAQLALERKGTRKSWEFARARQEEPGNGEAAETEPSDGVVIDRLVIADSRVVYVDHGSPAQTLTIERLEITDLAGRTIGQFTVQGAFNDAALTASGSLSPDKLLQVEAQASRGEARLKASGSVTLEAVAFDIAVDAAAAPFKDWLAMAGLPSPDATPVHVSARISGTPALVRIGSLNAQYGDTPLAGAAELTLSGKKPYLTADLTIPELRVAPAAPPLEDVAQAEQAPAAAPESPVPDTPIPTTGLDALDADLRLKVGRIDTPSFDITDLAATAALKDSVLRVDPLALSTSKGWVKGWLELNGAVSPPRLSADLLANDIVLEAVLTELTGQQSIENGVVKSDLRISGQGDTLRQALDAADGHFNFFVDNATYRAPAVEAASGFIDLLRGGEDGPGQISVDCGVGRFAIAQGVATSEALALKTSGAVVTGEGTVRLRDATINMRLSARSGFIGAADIVPPLKLKGPIASPKVRVDSTRTLLGIGKMVLGATTGIGLAAVFGEQVTDELGITESDDPCLRAITEQAPAAESPAAAPETLQDNIKQLEDDTKVIRDGLRGIFKKEN